MLKRRDIEARIVRQLSHWNVNRIAGFNETEGAPSMRYKRNEFYIGRSGKQRRRSERLKMKLDIPFLWAPPPPPSPISRHSLESRLQYVDSFALM